MIYNILPANIATEGIVIVKAISIHTATIHNACIIKMHVANTIVLEIITILLFVL